MRHGRADFLCASSSFANNIYVFGGAGIDEFSKVIEKYDSILDIWTTITFKMHTIILTGAA